VLGGVLGGVFDGVFDGGLGYLGQQPRADRGVDRGRIGAGQHPPQRCLRWERRDLPAAGGPVTGAAPMEHVEQHHGHVGDPSGDRGERPHPAQHRCRAQHEHDRDRVIPTLVVTPVRHPGEPLQQVSVAQRGQRQIDAG